MSTTFQTCPGCDSFILSDTAECPECGHVFDEVRATASQQAFNATDMKNQQMYDTCRKCGEQVRSGLVRCWSCNTFMRSDVEARFKEMQMLPQQIIFSDIPKDQRTEFISPEERALRSQQRNVFDADDEDDEDDEFTLRQSDDEFQLRASPPPARGESPEVKAAPEAKATPKTDAAPEAKTATDAESDKASTPTEKTEDAAANAKSSPASGKKPLDDFDADDLVGIAMQDQRESQRRKREKLSEARKRRILMPCACGAWIRVHQDQGGKTVRCRQCKSPVVVPTIKRREKAEKKEKAPQISVTWLDDLHLHIVAPTDVVLKPGSLQKTFEAVDGCFHDSGLYLIKYAPQKKSLFGKAADGPPDLETQRAAVREQAQKTGAVTKLEFGDLFSIVAEQTAGIRLVQPVTEAHESMFAGVPVFGEGQIAIYLPLELQDNKQAFLSLPLSDYRLLAAQLKTHFSLDVGAEQNGVPAKESYDSLKCFLSEVKIESLRDVVYYQNDPAFELELAGFICGTCGIAVTEEARAKKKLGGAAGKGIAKAKCPKCSSKFGDQKAWRIAKAPGSDEKAAEEEEDVSEVLRPKVPKKAKESTGSDLTRESISGKWKMVSIGKNGNFSQLEDMRDANINFQIEGDKYSVTSGDDLLEQGEIILNTDQHPAHLDQTVSDGPDKGKSHFGLVRLVDGKLENCQGDLDQPRPASFESDANSTASLAVFERV